MQQSQVKFPMQPDEWKINMNDAWQVLWWCRYLGLSKSQLEHAIKAVGPVIIDLKNYLAYQNIPFSELPPPNAPKVNSDIGNRSPAIRRSY